jgi:hypothetical protein
MVLVQKVSTVCVSKAAVPVGAALILGSFLIPNFSAASTGSWATEPSWANGAASDTSVTRRPSYSSQDRSKPVSPYAPGSNNVALDVGQVFLMGDLGTNYNDNIGAQIHYTYGVSNIFGFDSSLGYSEHSDGRFSMTTLLTGMRTNLAWYDKVVPYLVFGLGFYKPSYQVLVNNGNGVVNSSVSPILFGVHLGPGIDLELTDQLFFGAALTFHDVFGSSRATADGRYLDVGGTYTSFLLHAGVTF